MKLDNKYTYNLNLNYTKLTKINWFGEFKQKKRGVSPLRDCNNPLYGGRFSSITVPTVTVAG